MYTETADEALRSARSTQIAIAALDLDTASLEPSGLDSAPCGTALFDGAVPRRRLVAPLKRDQALQAAPYARKPRRRGETVQTFRLCLHYRITGLAAEAAFWVLLSLPALALGIVGVLGYLHGQLGTARALRLEHDLTNAAGVVLSQRAVRQTVAPALHSMLTSGHADVVSVGFLIALWSGSRALNVAIDTITVASGQNGRRGIVRTRLLAFGLYLPALLLGAATVPLLLVGTELLSGINPTAAAVVGPLAWPALAAALVVFLSTLYHLALPDRPRWRAGLPGALVALAVWAAGSTLLRLYLHGSQSGAAGFGRIAATAAILLWLYITALAVLIGAVFNAVRAGTSGGSARGDGAGDDHADDVSASGVSAGQGPVKKTVEPSALPGDNASDNKTADSVDRVA
ncbi:MAG TPA: YihY/virulence factor BrkB family protein [Actinocrinis sp.]|nr:YihY/virulence factor BrkB family protein [Actinocrinis sp.]